MLRFRTSATATILAISLLGACSSSDDDDDPSAADEATTTTTSTTTPAAGDASTTTGAPATAPEGSVIGITDDAITLSVLASDTSVLEEAGIVPEIGDLVQNIEVFSQLANESGGAGGREILVTSHLYPAGATATDQQPFCVAAAEDDQAGVVVFLGGMAPETVLCVTEQYERLAYAGSGVMSQEVYDRSGGRLFNHAMTAERLMAAWVEALVGQGTLEGATIGLVRHDQSDHEAAAEALEAALAAAGFEFADEVALPCENNACSQLEIGVERLQSAEVDTVFSMLGAVVYPSFVGAADAVGYDPQWLSSDFENQVFDVTAQFMAAVATNYDGAIGFSAGLEEPASDPFGEDCNARFSEVSGVTYELDTDAWRAVRSACYIVSRITAAANTSQETYGTVNQATLIEALETMDFVLGDQRGEWSPTKHDAQNTVVLKSFGPECLCWTEIDGSRFEFPG